jgi:hypothetical protein
MQGSCAALLLAGFPGQQPEQLLPAELLCVSKLTAPNAVLRAHAALLIAVSAVFAIVFGARHLVICRS